MVAGEQLRDPEQPTGRAEDECVEVDPQVRIAALAHPVMVPHAYSDEIGAGLVR